MQSVLGSAAQQQSPWPEWALWNPLFREVYILWKFTYYDLSTSVIPTSIFALVSWHTYSRTHETSWLGMLQVLAYAVAYLWAYIASFNISNQIYTNPEEDRINKPDRPLPSGLVTVKEAKIRMVIAYLIFAFLGWYGGFLWCSLTWLFVIFIHNHLHLVTRWGVKSWAMTVGTWAMLSAGWRIGGSQLTLAPVLWLMLIAVLLFFTCPIQDIRDQEGDRMQHRQTLPLLIGDRKARYFLAVVFVLNPIPTLLLSLFGPWEVEVSIGAIIAFNTVIFALCWAIAFRLLAFRNKAADHRSYMLYTYWFVCCLAFSVFLL